MDSLSQIVLGAALGNELLGKKLGNKAVWYGAIVGTIPDLDVVFGKFLDSLTAIDIHRGLSHSVLFFVFLAPLLGWGLQKVTHKRGVHFKEATWFAFIVLLTHALLDLFTTWGTQLFWPLENRYSLQSIFVIDPLYTLPFLFFLIRSMCKDKLDPKRKRWNRMGLLVSTAYLFFTLLVQSIVLQKFEKQLQHNNIVFQEIVVKPAPFNIVLWTCNVKVEKGYWIGDYSFLDTQPIQFQWVPTQDELIKDKEAEAVIKQLKRISEGWFCITQNGEQFFFNDLRFGVMQTDDRGVQFSFSYEIYSENGHVKAKEVPNKNRKEAKKLLSRLWSRVQGN